MPHYLCATILLKIMSAKTEFKAGHTTRRMKTWNKRTSRQNNFTTCRRDQCVATSGQSNIQQSGGKVEMRNSWVGWVFEPRCDDATSHLNVTFNDNRYCETGIIKLWNFVVVNMQYIMHIFHQSKPIVGNTTLSVLFLATYFEEEKKRK